MSPSPIRAKLVYKFLESLDNLSEGEIEQLWLDEAERRAQQIDDGPVTLSPGDEVLRKPQALLS